MPTSNDCLQRGCLCLCQFTHYASIRDGSSFKGYKGLKHARVREKEACWGCTDINAHRQSSQLNAKTSNTLQRRRHSRNDVKRTHTNPQTFTQILHIQTLNYLWKATQLQQSISMLQGYILSLGLMIQSLFVSNIQRIIVVVRENESEKIRERE